LHVGGPKNKTTGIASSFRKAYEGVLRESSITVHKNTFNINY
jgi:hypothetical protein